MRLGCSSLACTAEPNARSSHFEPTRHFCFCLLLLCSSPPRQLVKSTPDKETHLSVNGRSNWLCLPPPLISHPIDSTPSGTSRTCACHSHHRIGSTPSRPQPHIIKSVTAASASRYGLEASHRRITNLVGFTRGLHRSRLVRPSTLSTSFRSTRNGPLHALAGLGHSWVASLLLRGQLGERIVGHSSGDHHHDFASLQVG